MYKFLKYNYKSGVLTVTLNRPDVYNALNDQITYELQEALKQASKDAKIRVMVLTGEGKAFCSGQDLKEAQKNPTRSFSESIHKRYNPIIRGIRKMPKPVICKLNGVAAGAGCSLALACDMIIAAESSSLMEIFINIGLVLDSGSSYFLPRLVGSSRAFEMSTMGTKVTATEALEMGLVNQVVPDTGLDKAVKIYTNYYAKAPTKAIGLIKQMLNKSAFASLDEMLEYEAYCQEITSTASLRESSSGRSSFFRIFS